MGVYDSFEVDGTAGGRTAATNDGLEIDPACNWDPAVRLRDMDTANIDISVIFSSQSAGFTMLHDIGFESALHRAFHRFMADYCAGGEGRLRWVANSNLREIPETIGQLQHWAETHASWAGMLDNPVLHPLFAVSQELDLPIWVHGGSTRPPLTPWLGPGASNALHHGIGGQDAMAGLIGGGVFDLFPQLRIGLFESRAGWMPWLVEVLDDG